MDFGPRTGPQPQSIFQIIEDAMRRDTAGPLWNLQSLLAMGLEGGMVLFLS